MKINKGFIFQKLGEKITIFDSEKSQLLTLNETGSYIFTKLKNGWDIEKTAQSLAKKFGIQQSKALKDVTEFVQELKKERIFVEK